MILALFTTSSVLTWYRLEEVNIFQALSENKVDFTETFGPEQGFYVAAALTEYDTNTEIIEEAKYGELIIEFNGWGYSDELGDNKKSPLSYHPCSD